MVRLISLFLIITLYGCSENKEEFTQNIPDDLIGKWKIIEVFTTERSLEGEWESYDTEMSYDIWYKKDGKVIVPQMIENCDEGSYSVSLDNEIIINLPCTETAVSSIESLSENELITNTTYIEYELTKSIKVE